MRIAFDIDGVLAAFVPSYEMLFAQITGRDNFKPVAYDGPESWNWPSDHYGYTKEETKQVWDTIKKSRTFWQNLPPTPGFGLFKGWWEQHEQEHEVYFVTARPGTDTKFQTEQWFIGHLGEIPTVLISEEKGEVCHALGIEYYVDDKAENILDVQTKSPKTLAYLIDKQYNRHIEVDNRIKGLGNFLDTVNHESQIRRQAL